MRPSFRIPRLPAWLLGVVPALLVLSSCGDSDRSPTSPGAATLSGTLIRGTSASSSSLQLRGMEIGLVGVTVRVSGTEKSTVTDGSGNFTLTGLTAGPVDLDFERADIHALGRVSVVAGAGNTVTIAITGSTAAVTPRGHAGEEIEGLVSAIDGGAGTLTVLDQRLGAVLVQTDGATLVRNGDTTIPLSQIQVGNRVHVKALEQADGTFLATEVLLQSDRVGGNREVSGTVASVDAGNGSFVVGAGAGNVTVRTDSSTRFRRRGAAAAFSDIAVGVSVEVNGTLQADGSVLARRVTIES